VVCPQDEASLDRRQTDDADYVKRTPAKAAFSRALVLASLVEWQLGWKIKISIILIGSISGPTNPLVESILLQRPMSQSNLTESHMPDSGKNRIVSNRFLTSS
jgi:hypothetical protein